MRKQSHFCTETKYLLVSSDQQEDKIFNAMVGEGKNQSFFWQNLIKSKVPSNKRRKGNYSKRSGNDCLKFGF